MLTHLDADSLCLVIRTAFLFWPRTRDTFTKGNLWSSFRQTERGGQRTLPTLVDSQLPSTQNNIYVKVAHFGVAYPRPLQYQNISNQKEGNMQKLHQDWNANWTRLCLKFPLVLLTYKYICDIIISNHCKSEFCGLITKTESLKGEFSKSCLPHSAQCKEELEQKMGLLQGTVYVTRIYGSSWESKLELSGKCKTV